MKIKRIIKSICKKLIFSSFILQKLYHSHWYSKNYLKKNPMLNDKIENFSEHGIVYLLAPAHSNLGDVAIFVKSIDFLKKYSDIPIKAVLYGPQCTNKKKLLSLPLYNDDLIIIQGGGNMGALYPTEEFLRQNIVKWFPENKIISMSQTVFFGEEKKNFLRRARKIYSSHKNLTIFTRDVPSLEFCKKNFGCNIELCPDMVLSSIPERITEYQKNKKVMLCFRKDKESSLDKEFSKKIENYLSENGYSFEYWDTDDLSGRNIENKSERINKVLKYFNQFQFVITDRYHGTILSYISKTPCIGLDNSYGKVKNGFVWFKNSNYMFYADRFEQIVEKTGEIENLNDFKINEDLIFNFDLLKKMLSMKNN